MKLQLFAIIGFSLLQTLSAQSEGSPVVDQTPEGIKTANAAIIAKIRALIDGKKLLSRDEVKKRLLEPDAQAITLLPVKQKPLSREEVADVARAANLRVGYCYLCAKCDDWHLNLAGGYAIAPDVVATCDRFALPWLAVRSFLQGSEEWRTERDCLWPCQSALRGRNSLLAKLAPAFELQAAQGISSLP